MHICGCSCSVPLLIFISLYLDHDTISHIIWTSWNVFSNASQVAYLFTYSSLCKYVLGLDHQGGDFSKTGVGVLRRIQNFGDLNKTSHLESAPESRLFLHANNSCFQALKKNECFIRFKHLSTSIYFNFQRCVCALFCLKMKAL